MLVDCRGLESALEAVRVSEEAVRVSVEAVRVSIEALRCLRGCDRLEEVPENVSFGRESVAEAKKGPAEFVREPVGKTVVKNSGTHQNVLVLFQSFKIKWKSSTFAFKNSRTHQNVFWFCYKIFRLNGKVPILFLKFWNTSKRFGLFKKILEHIKTFWFRFKVFRIHGNVPISI
jgi:hypothetical protein